MRIKIGVVTVMPDTEVMSATAFQKAVMANNWAVITESGLARYKSDLLSSVLANPEEEDFLIEKAYKDISKLVAKVIVDSIGRRKTVYIKPIDSVDKKSKEGQQMDDKEHGWNRFQHNIRVQRMSKEASHAHIERHYGKDVSEYVRQRSSGNVPSDASSKNASVKDHAKHDGFEYMTAGRNKISVHPNALLIIRGVMGRSDSQKDIEDAKASFMRYMTGTETHSDKKAAIIFHRFLKNGDNEQNSQDGGAEGKNLVVDMSKVMSMGKERSDTSSDKDVEAHKEKVDVKEIVKKYTLETINSLVASGVKVDRNWAEGIANNYYMLKNYIDQKDYGMLRDMMEMKNRQWRGFFQDYTGIALPPSDKETSQFLFKYTGA